MEAWELELIERYKDQDEDLRSCIESHLALEQQIEELNRKVYLTPEEEFERKRLQKLKLAGRDKMEKILSRYKNVDA